MADYLDFPFDFDGSGRAARTDPDDHIKDMIYQVLFTSPGERVNLPNFGSPVQSTSISYVPREFQFAFHVAF